MPAAIEFQNVSFAFDENVVLDHLSFGVPVGGTSLLLGASGAGKSVA
jgi:ABC-type multidrug transport system fused ATPase/permease subunit